jgi:ubiquinone/menaquinone biosynthesis C-methylase UbiE
MTYIHCIKEDYFMNSKKQSIKHFDKISRKYDSSFDGIVVNKMYTKTCDAVLQNSRVGANILDLGCGTGNLLAMLQNRKNFHLTGLDISTGMIEEARIRFADSNIKLAVGDSEALPFEDDTFDTVLCNASFHHYTKPDLALYEINRVLRANGKFILGDVTNKQFFLYFANIFMKLGGEGDYHVYSKKEMGELLEKHGFLLETFDQITKRSFLFCASKRKPD